MYPQHITFQKIFFFDPKQMCFLGRLGLVVLLYCRLAKLRRMCVMTELIVGFDTLL